MWRCNNKSIDPFTAKTLSNRTTLQPCRVHGDQSSSRQLSRWRACDAVRQYALYRDLSSHGLEVAASHVRSVHGGCIRCGQYHFSLRGKWGAHCQPQRTYNAFLSERNCVQHQSSDDDCRDLYHGTPNNLETTEPCCKHSVSKCCLKYTARKFHHRRSPDLVESVTIRSDLGWNTLPENCCALALRTASTCKLCGPLLSFLSLATVQCDSTYHASGCGFLTSNSCTRATHQTSLKTSSPHPLAIVHQAHQLLTKPEKHEFLAQPWTAGSDGEIFDVSRIDV